MPNTFTLIASSTAGSGGAADFTFTSIPSTYTDLCVYLSGRSTASFTRRILRLRINGSSTASDYSGRDLIGSGSAASSGTQAPGDSSYIQIYDLPAASATANTFGNISIYIPNYANSSTYKSISVDSVAEDNATAAYMSLLAGLYNQNTAISQIYLAPDSGNFAQHSTAYLYGIKKD
jgi:hypothetical protein